MKIAISSTEAVRNFGDCLARLKYRGDSFVVTKNNSPVAELVPVAGGRRGTWGEVREVLRALSTDPAFAEDLSKVNAADQAGSNPWD
jgi:prevent-host-death family protein